MQSLERVRRVLADQPVDRLPVQPVLMMYAARNAGVPYIDYVRDGARLADAQLKIAEGYGIDCVQVISDPARELIDIAGDESIAWEDSGPAIVEDRAALRDKRRLTSLRLPDPLGEGRMHDRIRAIETLRRTAGGGMSIVGWVEGPLALGAELRGLNNLMTDFHDDPVFVSDLLQFSSDVAIRFWEPQVDAGADTIGMSDAAASMIGPDLYARFVFPAQLRVIAAIKSKHPGVIVRIHMCGQISQLLQKARELPADIFEIDYPVDLREARAVLGPGPVILGNVSTVGVMLNGTPEQVYEAARRCHGISGPRHIVGTGCEVSPLTPPENLRALVAYACDHRPEDLPEPSSSDD